MLKKIIAWALLISLTATASIGATVAYLTSQDSDVNVMTLGNVKIKQLEYERVTNEDGDWVSTGETDKYGYTPDKVQKFKQNKPLYPAVFADGDIKWDDRNGSQEPSGDGSHQQSWGEVGASGSNQLFDDSVRNAQDKFVFVENTGRSDAYVRTLFAFEQGQVDAADFTNVIMTNRNTHHWSWTDVAMDVEIAGNKYVIREAVYMGPTSDPTGILAPGKISYPSLLQVYMKPEATNEDVEAIDGNGNGTYDILVLSQAVQVEGFDAAAAALDTAFGDVDAAMAAEWFKDMAEEANSGNVGGAGPNLKEDSRVEYNGTVYDDIYKAVEAANANGGGELKLLGSAELSKTLEISSNITINSDSYQLSRAEGFTGHMIRVSGGVTLTANGLYLDGGANEGVTATGNLIATEGSGSIVLNAGTVLQNNSGAHAVSLATRGGGSLTLKGGWIVNNSSDSGAIWGGGAIIVNDGSKINDNSSTGSAGAIRMVSGCNLTMNGGEICNNTAAASGGAIWGYGSSTYNFNGGKMSGNTAAAGGAMYTGDSSVVNISGTFELTDNTADDAGALRLSNRTAFNMTGGTVSGNTSKNNPDWDGFYGWNPAVNITGGALEDDICIQGGLTPTVGGDGITGVIHFDVSTNHNTVNLAKDFGTIRFTVAEGSNFGNFHFKPAADYTYQSGDEAKLVCLNSGYSTYWDAASGTFKLQ